jgi:hypothetical protein
VAEVDKWESAHFAEDEMRSNVKEAKAKQADALREKLFGFWPRQALIAFS